MNQTNESSFEPDFNHFGPYLGPQFSFFFFFFLNFTSTTCYTCYT